jgi:hypothetical protein
MLLPVWSVVSVWRGQGAEPVPAGKERLLPRSVGADGQGSLAGVAGQAGGDVPNPAAERVRVGGILSGEAGMLNTVPVVLV